MVNCMINRTVNRSTRKGTRIRYFNTSTGTVVQIFDTRCEENVFYTGNTTVSVTNYPWTEGPSCSVLFDSGKFRFLTDFFSGDPSHILRGVASGVEFSGQYFSQFWWSHSRRLFHLSIGSWISSNHRFHLFGDSTSGVQEFRVPQVPVQHYQRRELWQQDLHRQYFDKVNAHQLCLEGDMWKPNQVTALLRSQRCLRKLWPSGTHFHLHGYII